MRAFFVVLAMGVLAACSKSESVPASLSAAGLQDRQWKADDFRLAAKVSMQAAMLVQPALEQAAKRGDADAAVDAVGGIAILMRDWEMQQDPQLAEQFEPCQTALNLVLNESFAIYQRGDFDDAQSVFEKAHGECLGI